MFSSQAGLDRIDIYLFTSSEAFTSPPRLRVRDASTEALPSSVEPYRLCDECRAFCRSLQTFTTPHRFHHYANGSKISQSARSGCHLCSVVLQRLRYIPPGATLQKWVEDDRPIDSVVDQPKLKHRFLRQTGKLILDFYLVHDVRASDRLNFGSVYLEGSAGT